MLYNTFIACSESYACFKKYILFTSYELIESLSFLIDNVVVSLISVLDLISWVGLSKKLNRTNVFAEISVNHPKFRNIQNCAAKQFYDTTSTTFRNSKILRRYVTVRVIISWTSVFTKLSNESRLSLRSMIFDNHLHVISIRQKYENHAEMVLKMDTTYLRKM